MGGALSGPYTLLLGPVLLEISTSFPVKKIATKRSRKPYRRDARKKSKNNEGARITTSAANVVEFCCCCWWSPWFGL